MARKKRERRMESASSGFPFRPAFALLHQTPHGVTTNLAQFARAPARCASVPTPPPCRSTRHNRTFLQDPLWLGREEPRILPPVQRNHKKSQNPVFRGQRKRPPRLSTCVFSRGHPPPAQAASAFPCLSLDFGQFPCKHFPGLIAFHFNCWGRPPPAAGGSASSQSRKSITQIN
jgi:hypothetical protein